jgi:apolipoprotein N-acyltransferase
MIMMWIIIAIACICVALFVGSEHGGVAGTFTFLILALVLGGAYLFYLNNTASGQRTVKSFDSNVSGGLERTVEVFDYNGDLLRKYEGKIDLREGEVGKTLFDKNGKRIVIEGGIVITEEK